MGMGQQDMGGPLRDLGPAIFGEHRVAGQPGEPGRGLPGGSGRGAPASRAGRAARC